MTTSPMDAAVTDAYVAREAMVSNPTLGSRSHSDGDGDLDPTGTTPRRAAVRAALLWAALAAVATSAAALGVVDLQSARAPGVRWWLVWLVAAHRGLLITLGVYVTFRVTERFPIGFAHLRRRLGVHAITALTLAVFSTVELYWYAGVAPLADPKLPRAGWGYFFRELLGYVILASLAHGLVYARRYWQIRTAANRLRSELADAGRRRAAAELRALKAEINPHFLGNALHAVSGLLRTDPAAAERVLAELGALLRVALTRGHTQEVTLREELDTLEPFLDVERARLGWRFGVELDVGQDALGALVPDMILQPMVENAVRRGLARHTAGCIRIAARRIGARSELLEVRVADEGSGVRTLPAAPLAPPTAAAWVANARARLAELYGPAASLELSGHPDDTTASAAARLTMPWHEAEAVAEIGETSAESMADDGAVRADGAGATRRRRWPIVPTLSFLVLGVLLTFPHLKRPLPGGTFAPVPLRHAIPAGFVAAAIMVTIGCAAFRVARRHPPVVSGAVGGDSGRLFIAHAKAAIAVGVLGGVVRTANAWVLGYLYPTVAHIRVVKAVSATIGIIALYVFLYIFLAVVAYGVEYARRYRQARAAARRLSAELAEVGRRRAAAELCALKAELNPHFLGNALHTVSALVRTDPDTAERVLAQLGELLRAAVTHSRTHEVTLREELETLEPYLAVAQARLGRRLDVRWDVEEVLLDARVPHMILQPLVENAVKHGLAPQRVAGHIEVAARRGAGRLELSVRDDGIGLESNGHPRVGGRRGVGLANTRARLAELYGGNATLELMSSDAGGAVARLSLPRRDTVAPPVGMLMHVSSARSSPKL